MSVGRKEGVRGQKAGDRVTVLALALRELVGTPGQRRELLLSRGGLLQALGSHFSPWREAFTLGKME